MEGIIVPAACFKPSINLYTMDGNWFSIQDRWRQVTLILHLMETNFQNSSTRLNREWVSLDAIHFWCNLDNEWKFKMNEIQKNAEAKKLQFSKTAFRFISCLQTRSLLLKKEKNETETALGNKESFVRNLPTTSASEIKKGLSKQSRAPFLAQLGRSPISYSLA